MVQVVRSLALVGVTTATCALGTRQRNHPYTRLKGVRTGDRIAAYALPKR